MVLVKIPEHEMCDCRQVRSPRFLECKLKLWLSGQPGAARGSELVHVNASCEAKVAGAP